MRIEKAAGIRRSEQESPLYCVKGGRGHAEKCEMIFTTYYSTNRRHDIDNSVPKFLLDGFSESGLIVDDDSTHLYKLTLQCAIDKDNPHTEIKILY